VTAIPELIEMLEIAGSVITIDAMGCQKDIASLIFKKKGGEHPGFVNISE